MSGPGSPRLLRGLFSPSNAEAYPGHVAGRHVGALRLEPFPVPVRCTAFVWPTQRSYTGQPSAELHLPGSPPVVEATLAALHAAGFRPAGPGEFTLRAFLAGRVGLTEAEAVLGVIDAADPGELHTALNQLTGGVSNRLEPLRSDLLDLLADLEAGLDFAEEDVSFVAPDVLRGRIEDGQQAVRDLVADAAGRAVSGVTPRVVLAGPPNAGKSSLFNALSGRSAVLVSPTAGTTRDDVSTDVSLGGLTIELVDTAGEETAGDDLSAAAQHRRAETLGAADLVLHCVPPGGSVPPVGEGLVLFTKADLRGTIEPGTLAVSATTGDGLEELRTAVAEAVRSATPRRHLIGATAARGGAALNEALAALDRAREVAELGDELVAAELRAAVDALGEMLGVVYHDDLLGRIFGRFCIGK
ncbi:tRNA modification GTPase MnmE [Planctomycetes bacterium LzC2]|uniref:tRNA modification GTPase MnmE n=2 Tax=Alienimonas chondri TaxID=2681879 RepID=A0ABX1VEV2_9PLAN|nr:tRNA modification GTPase MnmE [Alienimonas chondri]